MAKNCQLLRIFQNCITFVEYSFFLVLSLKIWCVAEIQLQRLLTKDHFCSLSYSLNWAALVCLFGLRKGKIFKSQKFVFRQKISKIVFRNLLDISFENFHRFLFQNWKRRNFFSQFCSKQMISKFTLICLFGSRQCSTSIDNPPPAAAKDTQFKITRRRSSVTKSSEGSVEWSLDMFCW